jgi:hypothetical protein
MDQIEAPGQQAITSRNANTYELKGGEVHVSFSATSITGEPLLEYRDSRHHVSARGKEIQQVDIGIGTLVTIVLEPNADAGALLFSVVIPPARLVGADETVPIHTLGITTRTAGFILATAQLDNYSVVKLSGEASFVVS